MKAFLTTPELKGDLLSFHVLTQNAAEGPDSYYRISNLCSRYYDRIGTSLQVHF